MRKPIDSAIFLTAITATLYSWGTANYHGFLITAGLDSDMMERSFHQVVYSGFLTSFGPILLILFLLTAGLFAWSHAVLPSYIDYVRGSVKAKRKIIKLKRFWVGKRETPAIEMAEKKRFNRIGLYCLLSFLYFVSLWYFEKQGQTYANEALSRHLSGKNNPNELINITIDKKEKLLFYLSCGSKNCAGIEAKTNKVYYFPQTIGYNFTYNTKN